ncbi:MAG: acyl-CoA carboxylase subunit beta [Anaerolineaceae bacterium]|nr:acyl-CoA carboxylase subunit beta [Anaerolineaceae bacterium]
MESGNKKLLEYREKLLEGGGKDRIEVQHCKGKLTARERVLRLLDEGSFVEIDSLMTHRQTEFGMEKTKPLGDGFITGFGKINGKRVCIYAQDFTVFGGSFSEIAGQKVSKIMDMATQAGVPVIGMNDGGGARIQEGVYSLQAFGELFYRNSQASGVIPQISVQLGPCAGGAVYSPALTDFIVMTQGISNMFITGPEVIKTVTGEEVDADTLGGAMTHSAVSGVAHLVGSTEEETFAIVRKLLDYLPSNNTECAKTIESSDDPNRADSALDTIIPEKSNETYDMHEVINRVVDRGSFFEIHANFAQNALVGFARLNGEVIGVIANQPAVMAGVLDINASDKIARFVRFCDAFNIPLITFVDTPGFMPGSVQEHGGIIRHGAKIVYAYSEATVPKLTVITRKGYGGAYIVMGSKHVRADLVFVWPTAEVAVMGADGAVSILHGRELKAMEDKDAARAKRQELAEEYREKFSSPYTSAGQGHVDDVILPSETRQRLISSLDLIRNKQVSSLPKKHSNMPL